MPLRRRPISTKQKLLCPFLVTTPSQSLPPLLPGSWLVARRIITALDRKIGASWRHRPVILWTGRFKQVTSVTPSAERTGPDRQTLPTGDSPGIVITNRQSLRTIATFLFHDGLLVKHKYCGWRPRLEPDRTLTFITTHYRPFSISS